MKAGPKPEAKTLSLWAIVLGGAWVAAHSLLMAFWPLWSERPYGLSMRDAIVSGAFLIISWSPVYGSVWIDKFLGRKLKAFNEAAFGLGDTGARESALNNPPSPAGYR
jgi:hypothetical protein